MPLAILPQPHISQEVRVDQHAIEVGPRDRQPDAFLRPDCNQYRVKSFFEQIIQVFHAVIQAQVNAQIDNILYLPLNDGGRQTELRDAQPQHPPGHRHRLEHRDAIARQDEVPRRRHPARPRPDDRHMLPVTTGDRLDRLARLGIHLFGDKPLQRANVDRFVDQPAIAGRLAAVVADAPADAGEWIIHLDHAQRIIPTPLANQRDVPLRSLPGGAGIPARGNASLVDGVGIGHSLGIQLVGSTAARKPHVEYIGHCNRANLRAIATANTLVRVNIARLVPEPYHEMPRLPGDVEYLGLGHDGDVGMATGFNQFG